MTAPTGPFTVTPTGRATSMFTSLADATAYANRLLAQQGRRCVITDATGQIVSVVQEFDAPGGAA